MLLYLSTFKKKYVLLLLKYIFGGILLLFLKYLFGGKLLLLLKRGTAVLVTALVVGSRGGETLSGLPPSRISLTASRQCSATYSWLFCSADSAVQAFE